MQRRILLLITDLQIGGTPTVVRELAVRLHDPPHVLVDVACLSPWGPTADQIRDHGIEVFPMNAKGPADFRALLRLHTLMAERRYDTVLSFLIHANAAAAIMKLVFREVRFIQSIQTTQPEPRWHWTLQRWIAAAAERILIPSESAKRAAMERSDISPEKIIVIPNAIEPSEFPRSKIATDPPTPFPIGFIGRLDPIKQVPILIREFAALSRKRNTILHIFGEGEERGHITAEIERLGLSGKIFLHGTITKPQAALEQIAMIVLPSAAEGFGLVLIEAMAAGVPVIANRAPGICDVVRDGETGLLVDVSSENASAGAICRLIDDRILRQRLIENGLAEVRVRFSWSAVMPAYRELLGL